MDERHGGVPAPVVGEKRELVVSVLCDHFAAGNIELDELERRLEASDQARSVGELGDILRDLPALTSAPPADVVPSVRKRGWVFACMGGGSRSGRWKPAKRTNAIAVMGGIELDFREARLGPGVTEVNALAVMGGIEIRVPRGLPVEVHGLGIMGGVDQYEDATEVHHPQAPRLVIRALACMGGIEVTAEPPEEA